jgi:uncharacterized protein
MSTTTLEKPVADPRDQIDHSVWKSIALHLGPGILMLGFYLATAPIVMAWGFPPLFASLLTIPLILVPSMLGYLGYEARRTTGRFDPMAVVGYRAVIPVGRMAWYTVGLIVWGAVSFMLMETLIGPGLVEAVFGWLPAWFINPADFDAIVSMSTGRQVIFLGSLLLFAGIVAPIVEEIYFRGHLLPGIARFGIWAPIINVFLFTLYHFESPWEAPGRFVMVLPLVYLVWRTRSLRLGIIVHVLLNTLSALALIAAVVLA